MIVTIGSTFRDDKGNTYILDKLLGLGGFGTVYKAHCEKDGTVVAIKVLQHSFHSTNAFLSFQKEMNLTRLIDAENVIKYYYTHDGTQFPEYPPYIIMEYTSDGTLRDLIDARNGQLFDIQTLKHIYLQLAHGMKSVSSYLVHRDIKPENVLNFNGTLKIADFGLSKNAEDSTKTLTFKNAGTPLYIAPEAWNNDRNTIQMDIYSMGIVFYELATLSYPYSIPSNPDILAIRDMHLFMPIINPSLKDKNLPSNIVSMIIKMLEKPTQNRYSTWDDILNVLEAEPLPTDGLSAIVEKAVSLRNERDIQQQKQNAEKEKKKTMKEEKIKLAYSQYQNSVAKPINDFAERFNAQYHQSKAISIEETKPRIFSPSFSTTITMPSGHKIVINGEVLFKENFKKTIKSLFYERYQEINYIPQCKGKDIILWCQLIDEDGLGCNILLINNDASIYGDWYIMKNSVNGFSRENRPSPFGFDLSDLAQEINYIGVTHIYDLILSEYSPSYIQNFLAERV